MDRAFIEHAEDQIDRDDRGQDQDGRGGERRLESLGVALEARRDCRRHVQRGRLSAHGGNRRADSRAGRQIEAERDRRKLVLVIHCQCRRAIFDGRELAERHHRSVRRADVNAVQRVGAGLERRIDLEDHVVGVQRGEKLGDVTLAECIVQRIVHRRRIDAEAGGGIAVDLELELTRGIGLVAADVGELGPIFQCLEQLAGPARPGSHP
jgi:hypothetical protein